jgi:hypothetical protein
MSDFGRTGPDEDLDVGHGGSSGGSSGSGGGSSGSAGDDGGVVLYFCVIRARV